MDARSRNKALFRSKLNAQKKEKRIESPLVRYNESDQPVCRVCDLVLKSESFWDAHQASRKHHEAIANLKANGVGSTRVSSSAVPQKDSTKTRIEPSKDLPRNKAEAPAHSAKPKPDSGLPHQASRKHHEAIANLKANGVGSTRVSSSAVPQKDSTKTRIEPSKDLPRNKAEAPAHSAKPKPDSGLPPDFFDGTRQKDKAGESAHTQLIDSAQGGQVNVEKSHASTADVKITSSSSIPSSVGNIIQKSSPEISKQAKGAIPEGFFDNKDADMHARGIKPVKIDVKDEYKEFEKLIQADLQEVDNRMEEEEIDAAELIEEAESVEQRAYRERVESLQKKRMELKAARSSAPKRKRSIREEEEDDNNDMSSESDDDDAVGNLAVDWRAQHL